MGLDKFLKPPQIKKVVDPSSSLLNTEKQVKLLKDSFSTETPEDTQELSVLLQDTTQVVNNAIEKITAIANEFKSELEKDGFTEYIDAVEEFYWNPLTLINDSNVPSPVQVDFSKLRRLERDVYVNGSARAPFFQTIQNLLVNSGVTSYLLQTVWNPIDEKTNILIDGVKEPMYRYILRQFQASAKQYLRTSEVLAKLAPSYNPGLTRLTEGTIYTLPLSSDGTVIKEDFLKSLNGVERLVKAGQQTKLSVWETLSENFKVMTPTFQLTVEQYLLNLGSLLLTDVFDDVTRVLETFTGLDLDDATVQTLSVIMPQMNDTVRQEFGKIQAYLDSLEERKHLVSEQVSAQVINRINYVNQDLLLKDLRNYHDSIRSYDSIPTFTPGFAN